MDDLVGHGNTRGSNDGENIGGDSNHDGHDIMLPEEDITSIVALHLLNVTLMTFWIFCCATMYSWTNLGCCFVAFSVSGS
jgi:hypothetical protein